MEKYKKDDSFFKMSIQQEMNVENSQKRLCKVVKNDFPIGLKLIIDIGGNNLKTEVVGHSDYWWSTAGEFTVKNIKTNKLRRVTIYNVVCKCDDNWNRNTEEF